MRLIETIKNNFVEIVIISAVVCGATCSILVTLYELQIANIKSKYEADISILMKDCNEKFFDDAGSDKTAPTNTDPANKNKDVGNHKNNWNNGVLSANVMSLIKTGKSINVDIIYQNISDKIITLDIKSKTHLLDEEGARWTFKNDSAQIVKGRDILPSKKVRTKMTFQAKDSQDGKKFDLIVVTHGSSHDFNHNILNISPNNVQ